MDMQMFTEILAGVLIFIILTIYIGWQIKKKGLKQVAIDMIIKAEDMYNKGQNDEKMAFVIEKIENALSKTLVGKILLHFITDDMIQNFIQSVFDGLKKALDYKPE
jgi:hypothetical protein